MTPGQTMIERRKYIIPGTGDTPTMVTEGYAYLDCGCRVYVGLRIDTKEAATMDHPCSPEHRSFMELFDQRSLETLPTDSKRPLLEVCDEILEEVNLGELGYQ